MISRILSAGTFLLAGLAAASPAAAKECGPLKQLASAKLAFQGKYQPVTPVTVNGVTKKFLVDTGGIHTQLSNRGAEGLNLTIENNATPIYDASGTASHAYAKVDSFEMGGMTVKDAYLRITPVNLGVDGLIAPDIMTKYDVEMDFAGGKLNYFLPEHCPGKVIYWPHGDVAKLSIGTSDKSWIKIPVELEGKSFTAILDTGATSTTISTKVAEESFGLTTSSPGMDPAGNVNGDSRLASYAHVFSSLTLDGIAIKNLRVIVMPDRITEQGPKYRYYATGGGIYIQKRMQAPDVILGMDVLKHLRMYFAFKEGNLYATAAEVPPVTETASLIASASPQYSISPSVRAPLQEAKGALDRKDYPAALAALARAREVADLKPYDGLIIHRFAMVAHRGMKDDAAAEQDAEAAANMPADEAIDAERAQSYKGAMLMTYLAKHFDKAAKYAKLYQATNPPATDQGMIRMALAHGNADNADTAPAK